MRIAILSDTTGPTPSIGGHGLGAATHAVAEGLRAKGHDVTLFAVTGSRFSGDMVLIDVIGPEHEPKLAYEVYKMHQEQAWDVIYDHTHRHDLARLFINLPVLNHYHDIHQPAERCPVVCSDAQRHMMNLPNARVIHHQLNPRDFIPSWRHDGYLAYLGILREYKQPLLAIEVAARLNMPLKIAGQTPHRPDWLFSGHENADYLGPINASSRNELLRGAACLLQFGTMESFGLSTVEAGMCGTPVAAIPAGGALDIIEEGVNGVFVNTERPPMLEQAVAAVEQAMTLKRKDVRNYTAARFGCPDDQIAQVERALVDCKEGRWW